MKRVFIPLLLLGLGCSGLFPHNSGVVIITDFALAKEGCRHLGNAGGSDGFFISAVNDIKKSAWAMRGNAVYIYYAGSDTIIDGIPYRRVDGEVYRCPPELLPRVSQ